MGPSTYCMVATCYTTGVGTHGTHGTVYDLQVPGTGMIPVPVSLLIQSTM